MNRRIGQLGLWVALGPLVGLFQGAVGFVPFVVAHPPRGQEWHDISLLLLGGLFYGLCWLTPAMLLADLAFLRRPLPPHDLVWFSGIIAGVGAIIGMATPGYLVMIGVPLTALGIMVVGFVYRRRADYARRT
jgi:hypothetical protein